MTTSNPRVFAAAALATALLLGFGGAPAAAQEPQPPVIVPAAGAGPALWVIRDADSTLYLYGTMHVLRADTPWGSARVDAAFASASQLIMEISNPDDIDTLRPLMQQYGLSPDRPLSSLLTARELAALDAAARTIGGSAASMDQMRPWLAGASVEAASVIGAGYELQSGVEPILRARAVAAGMTVNGFETLDEQVRILSGFPEEGQLAYLRRKLEAFESTKVLLTSLVGAWSTGDVETLRILGVEPMRRDGELLYQTLLVARNTNWADQIQTLLEGSGTAFIAVGALHLTGDDSVQEILRRRGVEAAPVP